MCTDQALAVEGMMGYDIRQTGIDGGALRAFGILGVIRPFDISALFTSDFILSFFFSTLLLLTTSRKPGDHFLKGYTPEVYTVSQHTQWAAIQARIG